MSDLPGASGGIGRPCPQCDAQPGEQCVDKFGRTRFTTHKDRKLEVND